MNPKRRVKEMREYQKEFKEMLNAIKKWIEVNDDDVAFVASFVSFDEEKIKEDKEDITKDNIILGFGEKENIELILEDIQELLKEEKGDFIKW